MSDINKDIEFFEKMRRELEEKHMGKWSLIYNQKFINVYDTFEDAAKDAVKHFGEGPYLIRQIGAPPVVLPASVTYFIGRHA